MRQKASTPAALKMAAAAMVLRNMLGAERVACETTMGSPVRGGKSRWRRCEGLICVEGIAEDVAGMS